MGAKLSLTLGASLFAGFMIATTLAFFFPDLRRAVGPVLCADGRLVQELPISNRRLNLYCEAAATGERREVALPAYLAVATLLYAAVAFVPAGAALELAARRAGPDFWVPQRTRAARPAPARDAGGRLRELEALRAQGLVTTDEYERKRTEILDEL